MGPVLSGRYEPDAPSGPDATVPGLTNLPWRVETGPGPTDGLPVPRPADGFRLQAAFR
jgi:hypothetical protein